MAREYTVKINVQSEKAAQQIEQFSAKAIANIEKINKVEIKPKTTTKDVEVSLNKLQEASVRAATAETNRAAAAERASATTKRAHATEVSALEKTKQKELDLEKATVQANARMEVQRMRLEQSQNAMHSFANATQNAVNQLKMLVGYAGATQMLRSALTEMKAMSDELVTYQKVTGATAQQMQQVRASAYKSAKQYGQSPSDYLSSVATMARAGYGQQAEAMANLATKTQLVGDMSAEMASKFLIAVDAGYRLNGNIQELEKVLNAANVADNNYATSLAQIAEGMTLIAPLAAGMNVSVNEATAAIGTMQALTQRSGTEVARAFRMIAINIAKDTETEVEEGFKLTQENVEDFNALLQEFASEELKAANAAGKLLSPMKAIEAIAKAWKSGKLNEQQLFTVLNSIGGARYTNNIMALVKNFDVYQEMLSKFSTELTSADDEVAAMMDSWSRKLEVLKTSWTEMVNNRISEDFIKSLLDMGTGFLNWTGNLENFIAVGAGAIAVIKQMWTLLTAGPAAMNPVVLAIGAVATALGIAKSAIDNHRKAIQDSSNAAAESASKAYDQAKAINELVAAYDALAADGTIDDTELDEAKRIQEEINKLVGDLPEKYNLVTGSIQGNKKALAELNEQQRKASITAAKQAKNEAARALENNLTWGRNQLDTGGSVGEIFSSMGISQWLKDNLQGTSFKYNALLGNAISYTGKKDAESIIKAIDELQALADKMTETFGDDLPEVYYSILETLADWETLAKNYKTTQENLKDLEDANYSRKSGAGTGTGSGTGTSGGGSPDGTAGGESQKAKDYGIYKNEAYAKSYDRLQKAIAAATTAQETFNIETKQTKADGLNFYAQAYKTLQEEMKAGRVNSTAYHAAAKAILGEEAYGKTGGYTTAIQEAIFGGKDGLMSLGDAIKTLTAEYKNQAGEVREGAGAVVLLEKLNELGNFGWKLRDEQGNYDIRMTEEMYAQITKAIPGLTQEMFDSALNALDQYDKNGRNTNLAPDTKEPEEDPATEAINTNTESTDKNTAALNEVTTALGEANDNTGIGQFGRGNIDLYNRTPYDNGDGSISTVDSFSVNLDGKEVLLPTIIDGKRYSEDDAIAHYERTGEYLGIFDTPGEANAYAELLHKQQEQLYGAYKADHSEDQEKAKEILVQAGAKAVIEAERSEMEKAAAAKFGYSTPTQSALDVQHAAEQAAYGKAWNDYQAKKSQEALVQKIETPKGIGLGKKNLKLSDLKAVTPSVIVPDDNFIGPLTKEQAEAKSRQAEKKSQDELVARISGKKAQNTEAARQDEKAREAKNDSNLAAIAVNTGKVSDDATKLATNVENINDISEQNRREAAKQQFLKNAIKESAWGTDKERNEQYQKALAGMDMTTANKMVELHADDITAGVDFKVGEADYSADDLEIQADIKAVLDDYSVETAMEALDLIVDEARPAYIEAMLDQYSLAEVMGALDQTSAQSRVAVIQAAIDKYGLDAVKAEFSKLTSEKRQVIIKALVDSGDYKTAAALLSTLSKSEQKKILAYLDEASRRQVLAEMAALTAPGYKTIYVTQNVKEGAAAGKNPIITPMAVGTRSHPGGLAMVNDGTGAELISDSTGLHIASGKNALVNLEKGAKVFTAEETRAMIGSVPKYANGSSAAQELADKVNDIYGSHNAINTGDSSYTQTGGSSSGSGKSGSSGSNTGHAGGSSSGSAASEQDERWEELKRLIEYILKRLNKALDAQEALIDKQIQELNDRREQMQEQDKLADLQESVAKAQKNLHDAETNRIVNYLDEFGQWHWMADEKKVAQAKEELAEAQKSLQDYLTDMVITGQINVLEAEKARLEEEYGGYTDLWNDILDAVDTPAEGLVELLTSIATSGEAGQKAGAAAVRDKLIAAMQAGSYKKNYTEAAGNIANAKAGKYDVPGKTDEMLAALIASSGTSLHGAPITYLESLQSVAGSMPIPGTGLSGATTNNNGNTYIINGVTIGEDMAHMSLSDILSTLSLRTNTIF